MHNAKGSIALSNTKLDDIIEHVRYLNPDWEDCLADKSDAFAYALQNFLKQLGFESRLCVISRTTTHFKAPPQPVPGDLSALFAEPEVDRVTQDPLSHVTVTFQGTEWDINGRGADENYIQNWLEPEHAVTQFHFNPAGTADIANLRADSGTRCDAAMQAKLYGMLVESAMLEGVEVPRRAQRRLAA